MTAQSKRGQGLLAEVVSRPVAVLLAHFSLALFGLLGWMNLPFNRMPDVEYPTIVVAASLPGATPDRMSVSVAAPLEAGSAQSPVCSTVPPPA